MCCTRYCNNIDIAAEKIFLWWNRSKVSDLMGGRGKRSSMKVIRDGLSSDNPALIGAQIPTAKNAFTRRVLMIDDAYWRLLWRIPSRRDDVAVVTFHILLPSVVNISRDAIKIMIKTSPTHFVIIGSVVLPKLVLCWIIIFWAAQHGVSQLAGDNDSRLRPSLRMSPRPQFITPWR